MGWIRITKDKPCPVCGREKFCMRNANWSAILCTKEPSDHQVGEAGWLHVLDPKRNPGWQPSELEAQFAAYQSNVMFAMPELLAEELGVTASSIEALGIGYYPGEQAWVWAEMDECGKVIGLLKRYVNGKKVMVKGSHRGLLYQRPLPQSDKPVIVVEGATDALAAMDMGYIAVSRPSADSGGKMLVPLLRGRDAVIVGENDDAGRKGMEKMFAILRETCASAKKLLPPAEHKDLRAWRPTAAEFELRLEQEADESDVVRTVEEINVFELARQWLDEMHTKDGRRLFHFLRGDWYVYDSNHYRCIESTKDGEVALDAQLYPYFNAFSVLEHRGKDIKCRRMNPRRSLIIDIKHALRAECRLLVSSDVSEPFLISSHEHIDVAQSVVFQNGLLDVDTMELRPLSPDVFVTSTLPYDYDPKARCDLWRGVVYEFFSGDQESHDLLQEWCGYNMVATNFMQQMLMLFGVPNSGKSTTLHVLQMLLGPKRSTAFDLRAFNDKFGPAMLVGQYAALISEDHTSSHADSERILQTLKKITGEDSIQVERKYCDPHSVRLITRFTYAGNELPIFRDDSGAILRRFNLLHYPNDFLEQGKQIDRRLCDKLRKEVQGIANWALEGLQRLLANGEFTRPVVVSDHVSDFTDLSSPLKQMVEEHCDVATDNFETSANLFELHREVFHDWGATPMSMQLFRTRLRSVVPSIKNTTRTVAGVRTRGYIGIQVRTAAKRKFLGRI